MKIGDWCIVFGGSQRFLAKIVNATSGIYGLHYDIELLRSDGKFIITENLPELYVDAYIPSAIEAQQWMIARMKQ